MENPFKKILCNEELPVMLKQKILDDVAMIKLTIDMADLFVVKFPNTMGDILMAGETTQLSKKKKN